MCACLFSNWFSEPVPPLVCVLQTRVWMEALVGMKSGVSSVTVAQVLRESAVTLRLTSVPAIPAETAPPARITSTALYASADPALTAYCVKTTSPSVLKGKRPVDTRDAVSQYVRPEYEYIHISASVDFKDFPHLKPCFLFLPPSSSCLNNGSCIDDIGKFTCRCHPGFYGEFCEYEKNECDSQPCKNGGTCTDGLGTYRCTCPMAYSGQNCQVSVQCGSA